MALDMEVGLGPSHIVLDGDPAPSFKRGQSPQVLAHFYCRQTAGWITMTLGMEVGLGPGDFVFDWDPATPRTEGTPTINQFLAHVYCGQTAGWMKMPLGTEVDLGLGLIVLDGPSSARNGTAAPSSSFRPESIVATVAHLSYCWALVTICDQ